MLRRPQPSDSEADLLREQERFLTSGAPSAASVVRRPDKRRGDAGEVEGGHSEENGGNKKDVVTIEGWKWVVSISKTSNTCVKKLLPSSKIKLKHKQPNVHLLCLIKIFQTNSPLWHQPLLRSRALKPAVLPLRMRMPRRDWTDMIVTSVPFSPGLL